MASLTEPVPCRSCGAPVVWVETTNGKRMPLDAEPCEDGNVIIQATGLACTVPATCAHLKVGCKTYKSHFATCPNAAQHRKAKKK